MKTMIIILLMSSSALAGECLGIRINENTKLKKFAEKMLEKNNRDIERELRLKNNTWINYNKEIDPNLDMHKSIEMRLP